MKEAAEEREESETVSCLDFCTLVEKSQSEALRDVLDCYRTVGLQATAVGRARALLQEVLFHRQPGRLVFLSYTSNLVSSGLRDTFAVLARQRKVDCFISSAGGIEEDVIKCLGKTVVARFDMDGRELRKHGYNRIGNLLVPNDNYCHFEDYFTKVIKSVYATQLQSNWAECTAPSDIIRAMGRVLEEQNHPDRESSLVYWCYKNDIPMFSPAFTDGSMGDMVFFHSFSKKGLVIDPMQDVVRVRALAAAGAGQAGKPCDAVILGGGLPKHYLMSNVDVRRVVIVTTGLEADGCTSACVPADDMACGLLREGCQYVRVQGDATIVFPLLLSAPRTSRTSEVDEANRGEAPVSQTAAATTELAEGSA